MVYLIVFLSLGFTMLLYFRVADHFNIVDKPNHRSSHTIVTIRGGGIIFYFAAMFYFVWSGYEYLYFFIGLTLMALISFLDDIFTLSNKLRFTLHVVSVLLLSYQTKVFELPWFIVLLVIFAMIGVINAYNFMDGINGITAVYSFAVLILLWLVNKDGSFINESLLYYVIIGNIVFALFNFRQKAKCFAGDVGSVSMAFILVFLLTTLILSTDRVIYLLFLAIYGVDTVWTIINRLYKGENIFVAHRTHLYQYLTNEMKVNKLIIASIYGALQLVIGLLTIYITRYPVHIQVIFSIFCLSILSVIYLLLKENLTKKHISNR